MASHPPWQDLPPELLEFIFMRLETSVEFTRSSSVCTPWRRVAMAMHSRALASLPPLLILHSSNLAAENRNEIDILCTTRASLHTGVLRHGRPFRLVSSFRGWAIAVDAQTHGVLLFHISSRMVIPLPPLENGHFNLKNFILSDNPTNPNCAVIAISQDRWTVNFLILGQNQWNSVFNVVRPWDDMMIYRNGIYLIGPSFVAKVRRAFDFFHAGPIFRGNFLGFGTQRYLLQSSSGDLIVVAKNKRDAGSDPQGSIMRTVFWVFKWDLDRNLVQLVTNFGEESLFLTQSCDSMFVSVGDSDRFNPNCIYFVEDLELLEISNWRRHGLFEYDMENGTTRRIT